MIDNGRLRIDDASLSYDDGRLRIDDGSLSYDNGRLPIDDGSLSERQWREGNMDVAFTASEVNCLVRKSLIRVRIGATTDTKFLIFESLKAE